MTTTYTDKIGYTDTRTRKEITMDKETKAQIMADIKEIMDKDKADKEFLQELLMEMQEAY